MFRPREKAHRRKTKMGKSFLLVGQSEEKEKLITDPAFTVNEEGKNNA